MAYNRGTYTAFGGTSSSPDYLYYNCDIINNTTTDLGLLQNATSSLALTGDPQIRFNETRDSALIADVSEYEMSIIRFTMNGANRDLPLFIPNILLQQTNVNLTTYGLSLTYQQSWNTNLGVTTFAVTPALTFCIYSPEVKNSILAPIPRLPLTVQDISSRYYWVFTYNHWLNIVNDTILIAQQTLYTQFQSQWGAVVGLTDPFPYPTFASFQAVCQTPYITYNEDSKLLSIYGDSDGFGLRLTNFTAIPYVAGTASPQTQIRERLFFNTNMQGLFANFTTLYWNVSTIPINVYAGVTYPAFLVNNVPQGYVYEIMFCNKFYSNVADYRIPPDAGIAPLGYVPLIQQKVYWINTQDYKSVDTLWSPCSAIVFTTSLIPIRYESTSAPNILGSGNLGISASTTASAFDPIITDIALDLQMGGADLYRQFIYYSPVAEYRMTDLSPSRQELRNIDIQVFWKSRLDSVLYPVNMYNLSNVSIKVMFRKKGVK